MKKEELFCLVLATVAFTAAGATPSWPAFRGPNSSGVANDATPPVKISPTNSVLWKVQVPWSPSSPCVWENQLYLTTFSDNELQTRCYQCQDGKLVWSRGVKPEKLEMFHSSESSPAASTPATDGERVVSYFGSFGLVCYDREGKELWRHALPVALSLGGYGTATSPLIIGKVVVVNHEQDQRSSLLALDLGTGKKIWETPRPDSYGSYGTPIVWQNNKAQEIIVPGSLRLKGYSLETGKEDWMVDRWWVMGCYTLQPGRTARLMILFRRLKSSSKRTTRTRTAWSLWTSLMMRAATSFAVTTLIVMGRSTKAIGTRLRRPWPKARTSW